MHGPDVNRLDILIINSSNAETTVWSREGTQGNVWRLGKVKLNDIPDLYSVRRRIVLVREMSVTLSDLLEIDHPSRCRRRRLSRRHRYG